MKLIAKKGTAIEQTVRVMFEKMVAELKAGGNVEEIVDKYVDCKTPELRRKVIDGIRQMMGNHMLENVKEVTLFFS